MNQPGKLVIVSGPSGAGKTTVVERLLAQSTLPLELSTSATTRQPRPQEQNGREYHFLSDAEFEEKRQNGEFLEHFEVFGKGVWYGTLREAVATGLNAGKWVLLEIDVQGMRKVVETYPGAITIFIHPGSLEELETRLRSRKTDSEESILKRLERARHEMSAVDEYGYTVINHNLDDAVTEIVQILDQHREDSLHAGRPERRRDR
jgi:guanylate kinase